MIYKIGNRSFSSDCIVEIVPSSLPFTKALGLNEFFCWHCGKGLGTYTDRASHNFQDAKKRAKKHLQWHLTKFRSTI